MGLLTKKIRRGKFRCRSWRRDCKGANVDAGEEIVVVATENVDGDVKEPGKEEDEPEEEEGIVVVATKNVEGGVKEPEEEEDEPDEEEEIVVVGIQFLISTNSDLQMPRSNNLLLLQDGRISSLLQHLRSQVFKDWEDEPLDVEEDEDDIEEDWEDEPLEIF
ncbi:hypothetical protein LIER_36425 [Lithospermum erythrorhizon]|uniref:Uncharacterized protein n=1 Tax=Lithospermum erythrorhizon TaxID=34254 RepID=A0AAV3P6H2_LITER